MRSFSTKFVSVLGSGIAPFFVTLITLPLLVAKIGLERYGLLAIVWLVSGAVSFIQLGMGRAVVQRINALRRGSLPESEDERSHIMRSAIWVTIVTSLLAGLAAALGLVFYELHFNVAGGNLSTELIKAAPYVGITVFSGFWVSLLLGIYQADERFRAYSFFRFFNTIFAQLAPLFAAFVIGVSFDYLIAAVALSRGAIVLSMIYGARLDFSGLTNKTVNRGALEDLLIFGGWTSILSFISPLLVILDRFVIGGIFGAAAVGLYSIAYNLCTRFFVLPNSISNVLLPRLAREVGDSLDSTSNKSLQATGYLMAPVMCGFIALYQPFVSLWMSPEIAKDTFVIGCILAVGVFMAAIGQVPYTRLTGEGRVKIIVFWHLLQVPFYALGMYAGLHFLGMVGAAVMWSLRTAVDAYGLLRIAKIEMGKPVVGSAALLLSSAMAQIVIADPALRFAASALLCLVSLSTSFRWFVALGGLRLLGQLASAVIPIRRER